jgi:hypothetical protein
VGGELDTEAWAWLAVAGRDDALATARILCSHTTARGGITQTARETG